MNIVMSYIDYTMAGLSEREAFSCTKTQTSEIYERLKAKREVLGAVLIATCNRTELYLSLAEGARVNPFEQLCEFISVSYSDYAFMNKTLTGDEAFDHLCKVAAGAESQIWGDGQIAKQVDSALKAAQEAKATDAVLNVLFRIGVTAGKRVKTEVDFNVHDNSTAARAVAAVKAQSDIKDVLVIGNGMIGRLVAGILVRSGIHTTMTLRQYKHGLNIIPNGVDTVNYSDRYSAIEKSGAVISATLSPHYTVCYEQIRELNRVPGLFVDLAVPRDIDPEVEKIEGVTYFDIDQISCGSRDARQEKQMRQIEAIVGKYRDDFYKWYDFREKLRLKEEA